jgi:hypothetical protein
LCRRATTRSASPCRDRPAACRETGSTTCTDLRHCGAAPTWVAILLLGALAVMPTDLPIRPGGVERRRLVAPRQRQLLLLGDDWRQ